MASEDLLREWKHQWTQIVVTALLFTAGVAWNTAFADIFSQIPVLKNAGSLVYAIFLTLVIVAVISQLNEKQLTTA